MRIKPEIKFGFLAGIALIVWTLSQFWLGFHTRYFALGEYGTYGTYVILFVSLWISLKEKQGDLHPHFTVRAGVRTGLIQLSFSGIIASVFMFFYDYNINPLWVENLISWQIDNGRSMSFARLANDTAANAVILSNTETHLCIYFLNIIVVGGSMAFMISAILYNRNVGSSVARKNEIAASEKV